MACIVCGNQDVELVLDLGSTAPANNLPTPDDVEQGREVVLPLRLGLCCACGHAQLLDLVPPHLLFDHYLYRSSASVTLTEHLDALARTIVERNPVHAEGYVLDVGCNDGSLLAGFERAGIARRVGVDPAGNLAPYARESGAEVVTAYFDERTATRLVSERGPAAVVTLTNTFPHIPDLAGLMRAVDTVLAEDGILVIEAHYVGDLLEQAAFDTIYHEHVSYWSLAPMQRLMASHGFEVFDAERLPIHHGQLRTWIARAGRFKKSDRLTNLMAAEIEAGLGEPHPYRGLAERIERIKSQLHAAIGEVRRAGGRVVGYGAPAKASTLLSILKMGPEHLDYVADKNTLKQGRLTPGTHVPIVDPARIDQDRPELVIVFAWNFADEIANQLSGYLRAGGRMVVPVPEVKELEPSA